MSLTRKSLPLTAALALSASAALFAASTFFDGFSDMPAGTCYSDGETAGAWDSVYDGYGCNAVLWVNDNALLFQKPMASVHPDETHANLVAGPAVTGDFSMDVSLITTQPLRTGSAPNPWEVAWVVWHYTDDLHFYYFIPKPNGWELGKADPAYPGAQRFLATGSFPQFPIGQWYRVSVAQQGATIQVSVNDTLITTFTDDEAPYYAGEIALYNEDAEVYFDDVSITAKGLKMAGGPVRGNKRK